MPTPGALHVRGRILPSNDVRDVWILDGHFTFQRPRAESRTLHDDAWLVPGLVDAHAHLALSAPNPAGSPADRVRSSARAHLDAGVLLIREPGSVDHVSAGIKVSEGLPRVATAGRMISPPGGYVPGLGREATAAQLENAIKEEAKASGAWVKMVGDFIRPDGHIRPHWDRDQLKRAVQTAHGAQVRIAIHATHPDSISDAIEAGFDTIEHGNGLRPEMLPSMVAKKVAWVPTMSIDDLILPFFQRGLNREGAAEVKGWIQGHPGVVAAAHKAGVTILAGTDAGMTPHGIIANEIAQLHAAGLAAEAALGAGSWTARRFLGYPGIEEGAPADLLAFAEDPRTGRKLPRPARTVLDGRVVPPAPT